MSRIIHLDLFSGMGGFSLGLHQAGIIPTHHYFSEIDTHAIANYRYNFKNAEYIGSVTNVRHIIRTIDRKPSDRLIITFGSPCQDFSLAGKRAGIEGSKSSLIKFAIFLIKRLRPDVYIWENVKGAYSTNNGADFWAIIQAFADIDGYGFEQQLVNTSWVLPQNRERIYLVGHLDGRSQPGVFPFGEDGKSHNDNKARSEPEAKLATTIGTREGQRKENNYVVTSNTTQGFEVANEGYSINFSNPNSKTRRGRVGKGVAQTLDTQCNQGVIQVIGNLKGEDGHQVQNIYDPNGIAPAVMEMHGNVTKIMTHYGHKNKEPQTHDIVPTLKAESHGHEPMVIAENIVINKPNHGRSKNEQFSGISPTLLSQMGTGGDNIPYVNNIRRLTEIECERLQGFPDDWTKFGIYHTKKGVETKQIPKTQRYKMCGNAVTATIVKIIAERIKFI